MAQTLDNLIEGAQAIPIKGLASHSKRVRPGDLFFARRPEHAEEALCRGAAALCTPDLLQDLPAHLQIVTEDVPAMEALVAARYYGHPSRDLQVIGVTGTNGKTTTALLIQHLLRELGIPCGYIGTLHYDLITKKEPATFTTPEALTIQRLLRKIRENGGEAVVLEVSSHGLAQKRTAETHFHRTVYTNLSHDHLDYHGDMRSYAATKARLFANSTAIINADCPYGTYMASHAGEALFYSLPEAPPFSTQLIGRHNAANCLAALTTCRSMGLDEQALFKALRSFPPPPGRLEPITKQIFVDFAHTPEALQHTLAALRPLAKRRLLLLFGCGGDRDREKRPHMARASSLADFTIVTSDNPRSEDPLAICQEIVAGYDEGAQFMVEVDRREALKRAIGMCEEGDILLVAGRGHEQEQILSSSKIPFHDPTVIRELLG